MPYTDTASNSSPKGGGGGGGGKIRMTSDQRKHTMIVACASTMQPTLLINVIQPPQTEIEHLTSKQHRNDVINYVVALHG